MAYYQVYEKFKKKLNDSKLKKTLYFFFKIKKLQDKDVIESGQNQFIIRNKIK